MEKDEAICCQKFEPEPWDKKEFTWENKRFIKGSVFTFLFMPVNYGGVITKMMKKIDQAGAKSVDDMGLSYHTSSWNMDLYLAVDREIPGAKNITLSGKYLSKVYEGDFRNTKKWSDDFEAYAKKHSYQIKKWYMWYTTCPKCAKKYGKNYVVIIGELR